MPSSASTLALYGPDRQRSESERMIVDAEDGRLIMRAVCQVLRRAGGLDFGDGRWFDLILSTRAQLAGRGAGYALNPQGLAHHGAQAGSSGPGTGFRIEVLSGLPESQFAAVCAHELGHIYMYRHGFPSLAPPINEGLCELCESVWLEFLSDEVSQAQLHALLQNSNPVYGGGFRSAYEALGGRRLVDVFDHVREFRYFPPAL